MAQQGTHAGSRVHIENYALTFNFYDLKAGRIENYRNVDLPISEWITHFLLIKILLKQLIKNNNFFGKHIYIFKCFSLYLEYTLKTQEKQYKKAEKIIFFLIMVNL